jgi:hypothetical protein
MLMMPAVRLICVLLFTLVGACGTLPRPIPDSERASIRNVAVFSALGQRVHLRRIGLTAFYSDQLNASVNWDLDRFVVEKARSAVAESDLRPRVTPIEYKPAELEIMYSTALAGGDYDDPQRAAATFKWLLSGTDVDTIVVFSRATRDEPELRIEYNPFIGHLYYPNLSYNVTVLDARTLKVMARRGRSVLAGYDPRFKKAPWSPELDANTTPAMIEPLRRDLERLLDEDIPRAVWQAGFRRPDVGA